MAPATLWGGFFWQPPAFLISGSLAPKILGPIDVARQRRRRFGKVSVQANRAAVSWANGRADNATRISYRARVWAYSWRAAGYCGLSAEGECPSTGGYNRPLSNPNCGRFSAAGNFGDLAFEYRDRCLRILHLHEPDGFWG